MSAYEFWRVELDVRSIMRDTFSRSASSSWGTGDTGQAWTTAGGSASNFSVNGSAGVVSLDSVNVNRFATASSAVADVDVFATVTVPMLALGDNIKAAVIARFVDTSNYYAFNCLFNTSGGIDLQLLRGGTVIATASNVASYAAGWSFRMWLQVVGTTVHGKVWALNAAPPSTWQTEATDTNLTSGGVGIRTRLDGSNTNTLPVNMVFDEFSASYVNANWIDITSDVDTVASPISATTGDDAESSGNPASLSLVLHNVAFKYTPGNTSSIYALTSGQGIRLSETAGYKTASMFTGFIEFPEISNVNVSMNQDQTIAISAVDQLSRWERSQTFVSTLGAHIVYNGGSALKAYWPLLDQSGPAIPIIGGVALQGEIDQDVTGTAPDSGTSSPTVTWAAEDPPSGDDLAAITFLPQAGGGATVYSMRLTGRLTSAISVAVGQVVTLVAWAKITTGYSGRVRFARLSSSTAPYLVDIGLDFGTPTPFTAAGQGNGWGFSFVDGGAAYTDAWIPVASRMGATPDTCEMWVGTNLYTAAMSTAGPGTTTFDTVTLGVAFPGSLAHVQVYVGSANDWDRTAFLAQMQMGLSGLDRQATGDRIKTIARYAGKTDADLVNVDTGCSVMRPARLAGMTVAQAMYEARDTEQGELYIGGDGLPVFADRRRLLNI